MGQQPAHERTRPRVPLLGEREPCPYCQAPLTIDRRWHRTPMRLVREGPAGSPAVYCARCGNFPVLVAQH